MIKDSRDDDHAMTSDILSRCVLLCDSIQVFKNAAPYQEVDTTLEP